LEAESHHGCINRSPNNTLIQRPLTFERFQKSRKRHDELTIIIRSNFLSSKTVVNGTNADDLIASTVQLTNSPEMLTTTDVIYAAEILNNIATRKDVPKSVEDPN